VLSYFDSHKLQLINALKVALDEGVPGQIAPYLVGHDVRSVCQLGLKGTKNGKLLDAFEAHGFEAVISNDKNLEFDQNLSRRPFAVLLLSSNHLASIRPHLDKIAAALGDGRKRQSDAPGVWAVRAEPI
jgi:hypothetical protein